MNNKFFSGITDLDAVVELLSKYNLKKGGKIINGVIFINKTHNTPSVNDSNLNMARYSLKLLKKKKRS